MAKQVQAALLPTICHRCSGAHVVARHQMSQAVGGDLYDFVPAEGGRYSLVIGDVSGHEVFSALVMSLVFGAIHTAGPKAVSPLDVIALVNDLLCDLNDEMRSYFMTSSLFFGTVDPRRKTMVYANAGHPPPVVYRRDDQIYELGATCPVLGVTRQLDRSEACVDLKDAHRLLLYTDGISEAHDAAGGFLGAEGIIDILSSSSNLSVEATLDRLFERALAITDGREVDDMTAVLADFGPVEAG
ncbi:MAG: serine/threonine-protein phosphatase [Phycisphaerae bacterium]|nr:serine/threonine-protein phosphatase [Phycisphaerae bacterium]